MVEYEEEEEEDTYSTSEMGLVESGDDGGSYDVSDHGDNPLLDQLLDNDVVEIPDTQPDAPQPIDSQPVDDCCPLMNEHDGEPGCTIGCEEETDQVMEEEEEFRPEDKALPYEPEPIVKTPHRSPQPSSGSSSSKTKGKAQSFDPKTDTKGEFDKETPLLDGRGSEKDKLKDLKSKLSILRKQRSALTPGFTYSALFSPIEFILFVLKS